MEHRQGMEQHSLSSLVPGSQDSPPPFRTMQRHAQPGTLRGGGITGGGPPATALGQDEPITFAEHAVVRDRVEEKASRSLLPFCNVQGWLASFKLQVAS